jgi:hypothetical protein
MVEMPWTSGEEETSKAGAATLVAGRPIQEQEEGELPILQM